MEEEDEKLNSNNNIDAVSTEDVKNARSETVEALRTEDDTKFEGIDNMVQGNVEEASIEFDICNPKFSREDGFWI